MNKKQEEDAERKAELLASILEALAMADGMAARQLRHPKDANLHSPFMLQHAAWARGWEHVDAERKAEAEAWSRDTGFCCGRMKLEHDRYDAVLRVGRLWALKLARGFATIAVCPWCGKRVSDQEGVENGGMIDPATLWRTDD